MRIIYQEKQTFDFNISSYIKPTFIGKNSPSIHWHSCYEILLIKNEGSILRLLDNDYELEKDSIVFLSPYIMHDVKNTSTSCSEEIVCQFSSEFIESIFFDKNLFSFLTHNLFLKKPFFFNIKNKKAIEALSHLLDLFPASKSNQIAAMHVKNYTCILFSSIFEDMNVSIYSSLATKNSLSLAEITNYLLEEIEQQNKVSLTNTAYKFGYENTYFSKTFKESFGFTFKDFVSALKIQKAKSFLQSKDYSVAKIADILNYNSPQNFCRAYKALTGISPYQYKKLLLEHTRT